MKVASGLKMRHSFLSESQEMYRYQVRVIPAPQKYTSQLASLTLRQS